MIINPTHFADMETTLMHAAATVQQICLMAEQIKCCFPDDAREAVEDEVEKQEMAIFSVGKCVESLLYRISEEAEYLKMWAQMENVDAQYPPVALKTR